jgi:hypothetical protein
VARQDGSVDADRSIRFLSDMTTLRVVGHVGFGVVYPSTVVKITAA